MPECPTESYCLDPNDVIPDTPGLTYSDVPKANQIPFDFNLPPHPSIQYTDFSSSIHSRPPLPDSSPFENEIYTRVSHPYNVEAFEELLSKHNLLSDYPLLINNLREGFPIGNMPKLEKTVIIPNHPSVAENMDVVLEYLHSERELGRMSGPFTQAEAERILRGPFYASPLIVAIQDQGPDLPPKRRVCRNLSKGDQASGMDSVNSFINKEDFPTRFDMAFRVAEAVSPLLCLKSPALLAILPVFEIFRYRCLLWNYKADESINHSRPLWNYKVVG